MSAKTKHLANVLARMYPDDVPEGPCACVGTECMRLGCSQFWDMFLSNPDTIRRAMELYVHAERILIDKR